MAASQSALARFFDGLLGIYRFFRSVLFNLLFLFALLIVFGALMGTPPVMVPPGSALLLDPAGIIVEQESYTDPLTLLTSGSAGLGDNGEVLLQDLLDVINAARDDERITSMLLMTDRMQGAGLTQLFDLGDAIDSFRASGKKVYALGSSFDQGQYLLASQADEILMHDFGQVGLEGLAVWQNYFQNALTTLGVNVHIFRVGEYKSAVEPFSRNDMSPESRTNYTRLLNDLWRSYVSRIEMNRTLAEGTINDYINQYDTHLAEYRGNTADLAIAMNLVDRINSRPAVVDYLKQQIGTNRDDELSTVDYRDYLRASPSDTSETADRIAVIVAEGEIVDGEAPQGTIGGETLSALIRDTASDDGIKALVLRINSPGGSAFASELVRSELAAFKDSGRPVVVSMGDTAASGGYWIASAADQIWAHPATLTGSIGIFGLLFTLEASFNKLGVGTDGVGTTALAGANALGRALPDIASRSLQLQIENGYQRFITLVAEARDLDPLQVDAIAQGQVWSGQAALDNGLVDQLGNLQGAIDAAASLAGVVDYRVEWEQPLMSPYEQFLKQLMEQSGVQALLQPLTSGLLQTSPVQQILQNLEKELDWALRANDPQHTYARCLECGSLRL